MTKQEKRVWLAENSEIFGNATVELSEIEKMQLGSEEMDFATITVGCGALFSLACC